MMHFHNLHSRAPSAGNTAIKCLISLGFFSPQMLTIHFKTELCGFFFFQQNLTIYTLPWNCPSSKASQSILNNWHLCPSKPNASCFMLHPRGTRELLFLSPAFWTCAGGTECRRLPEVLGCKWGGQWTELVLPGQSNPGICLPLEQEVPRKLLGRQLASSHLERSLMKKGGGRKGREVWILRECF